MKFSTRFPLLATLLTVAAACGSDGSTAVVANDPAHLDRLQGTWDLRAVRVLRNPIQYGTCVMLGGRCSSDTLAITETLGTITIGSETGTRQTGTPSRATFTIAGTLTSKGFAGTLPAATIPPCSGKPLSCWEALPATALSVQLPSSASVVFEGATPEIVQLNATLSLSGGPTMSGASIFAAPDLAVVVPVAGPFTFYDSTQAGVTALKKRL